MEGEERENKIEDIKRRLYDRDDSVTHRHREGVLHPINHQVDFSWKGDPIENEKLEDLKIKKPKTSIFKKFFIFSIIFLLIAVGYAIYNFSSNDVAVSNEKIDINVLGNGFVKGGEELPLQIEIVNRNSVDLELVDLIVTYPKGASDDLSNLVRVPREKIGTIKAGGSATKEINVTLYGEEKSTKNINISIEYNPAGSNSISTKEIEYPVTISTAPLSLIVNSPSTVSANQAFKLDILASLNTVLPNDKIILKVDYPNNFVFKNATPAPSIGNSVWDLSLVSLTNPIKIEINGEMLGQENDKQSFHMYVGSVNPNSPTEIDVTYNSYLQTVEIVKPFLEASILVNGLESNSNEVATPSGEQISIEIPWANNLPAKISDVEIVANISGNALNRGGIKTSNGFYNSANSQIVWNKNTVERLAVVDPGESGTVSFSVKPISLIGMYGKVKDPQIVVDVSIKGRQPNYGTSLEDINSFLKKTIRITTDFQIVSSAYYSAGFIPPKAEGETRYKITWTLSNSINNVNQAEARSALPIYVSFVGPISGQNEKISYNEVTRDIVWDIGTVYPTSGVNSEREVSFIVSLRPSLSQVGSAPQLMKTLYLTGKDEFTGGSIRFSANPISTLLYNDSTFSDTSGQVVR